MVVYGSDETKELMERIAPEDECKRMAEKAYEKWLASEPRPLFSKEQMEILSLAFAKLGAPNALQEAINDWEMGVRP